MSASLLDPPSGLAADAATGVTPSPAKTAAVTDLADRLGQTVHALQRARHQMLSRGGDGAADWNTRVMLAKIVMSGPKRVTELADILSTDASTVSRQAAAMVKDGLLERQADPADGRASLLVATDRGREAMDRFRAGRSRELAALLEDWTPDDCTTFARLLERFTTDLQRHTGADPAAPTTTHDQPVPKEHR